MHEGRSGRGGGARTVHVARLLPHRLHQTVAGRREFEARVVAEGEGDLGGLGGLDERHEHAGGAWRGRRGECVGGGLVRCGVGGMGKRKLRVGEWEGEGKRGGGRE